MNADGNPDTEPKGLLEIAGIQELDSGSTAAGDALTFDKIKEAQTLLEANNQDMAAGVGPQRKNNRQRRAGLCETM